MIKSGITSGSTSPLHGDMSNLPVFGGLLPPSENLKLWTRFNQGITETGLGVSQWDDQSGNGNHLKQGTDLDRPQKQADGSILTDGISQFLKADAFTLVQPETIYLLFKQVTWTAGDYLFDGNTLNSGEMFQSGATPDFAVGASAVIGVNSDLAIDTYGAASTVINGASTLSQVDNNAPVTGSGGTGNMGGFTLGVKGNTLNSFGNIQVKEVLIYSEAHNAETRAGIIRFLQSI